MFVKCLKSFFCEYEKNIIVQKKITKLRKMYGIVKRFRFHDIFYGAKRRRKLTLLLAALCVFVDVSPDGPDVM